MKYIGRISGFRGFKGELLLSGLPSGIKKIVRKNKLFIGFSEQFARPFTLKSWKELDKGAVILLEEIKNEKEAAALKEQGIFVDETLIKFKRDESYYIEQIIGCKVIDLETSNELGVIDDVWLLPGNDVWVVKNGDKELPLPFIDDVIKNVDLKNKIIEVTLIPGLDEL